MSDSDQQRVVVAYDGSPEAEAAIRAAVRLFGDHRLIVVSVWEPGLAIAMASAQDPTGIGYASPDPDDILAIDHAQREHAVAAAEDGARLARELGATAEPYPVADESDVAETIAGIAEHTDASTVVVGSRGLGKVKTQLFGSTSWNLLHRTRRPVLIVKSPE